MIFFPFRILIVLFPHLSKDYDPFSFSNVDQFFFSTFQKIMIFVPLRILIVVVFLFLFFVIFKLFCTAFQLSLTLNIYIHRSLALCITIIQFERLQMKLSFRSSTFSELGIHFLSVYIHGRIESIHLTRALVLNEGSSFFSIIFMNLSWVLVISRFQFKKVKGGSIFLQFNFTLDDSLFFHVFL